MALLAAFKGNFLVNGGMKTMSHITQIAGTPPSGSGPRSNPTGAVKIMHARSSLRSHRNCNPTLPLHALIYMFRLLFGISNCMILQSLAYYCCYQSLYSVANLRANTPFPVWSNQRCGTGLQLGRFELMLVDSCPLNFVDLSYVMRVNSATLVDNVFW